MNGNKIKFSPFDNSLEEERKYFVESGFTQEIFDTLVYDIDKHIEKIKEETGKLKDFFKKRIKGKKEAIKEFKKYKSTYYVLEAFILYRYWNRYFELIEQFKTPYNRGIQKEIEQYAEEYGKNNTGKFMEYLQAFGKYEYILNTVGKRLIELGIAEEYEMGENRHMDNEGTIVFTHKRKHIVTADLPKTPYYRKKVQIPDITAGASTEDVPKTPYYKAQIHELTADASMKEDEDIIF